MKKKNQREIGKPILFESWKATCPSFFMDFLDYRNLSQDYFNVTIFLDFSYYVDPVRQYYRRIILSIIFRSNKINPDKFKVAKSVNLCHNSVRARCIDLLLKFFNVTRKYSPKLLTEKKNTRLKTPLYSKGTWWVGHINEKRKVK